MKRRQFFSLLGGAVVAYPLAGRAQQSDQLRRIGVLMATFDGDPAGESRLAAFRAELAKLGWTEGRNLRIDVRWGADAHAAQLERYAADLIALGPDVLSAKLTLPLPHCDRKREQFRSCLGRCRSGRSRPGGKSGAPGGQRHRLYHF